MSDFIGHECGFGFVKLRKEKDFYIEKYGKFYLVNLLRVILLKQRNRGQQAAGIQVVDDSAPEDMDYMSPAIKALGPDPVQRLFSDIDQSIEKEESGKFMEYSLEARLGLGHVRYGTYGSNSLSCAHPIEYFHGIPGKRISIAGNFNFANNEEQKTHLRIDHGIKSISKSDMRTMLAKVSHHLNDHYDKLKKTAKSKGLENHMIHDFINSNIDMNNVLKSASKFWDGGYAIAGIIGNGDGFVCVDEHRIRPACYYIDDEIIIAASESIAITSALGINPKKICYMKPAEILTVKNDGSYKISEYKPPQKMSACHFEDVYFSRPNSFDFGEEIFAKRNRLGVNLAKRVHELIGEINDSFIVTYIPNSALPAALGLADGLSDLLGKKIHFEQGIAKDESFRTFIAVDTERNKMTSLAYNPIYSVLEDKKVIIVDDSIVRGNTLKTKIIPTLINGGCKEIYIVSSDAQIRYPCCYGIDMSEIGKFVAFEAVIELLKENKKDHLITKIYKDSLAQRKSKKIKNIVGTLYEQFSYDEISDKICEIVTQGIKFDGKIKIIYQTVSDVEKAVGMNGNLDLACLNGEYPTPCGLQVLNESFINFYEGNKNRSY